MPDGINPAIEGSRPSIEIAGQREGELTASMLRLDIVESEEGLARCALLFGNWGGPERPGFQYFDRQKLEFGKPLGVRLTDGGLFTGRIGAITATYPDGGPPQVGVLAEDRLQDLRMTRRTRSFADATLADVVRRIAQDHGLQAEVDLSGPRHRLLAQVNQSDLAFLRDRARHEDALVWADDTTLRAAARSRRGGGTVELVWAGTLREFQVGADLAHQRTSLVASGWNVADKQACRHEADEAAVRAELDGNDSGAAILRQAFGARPDTLAHGLPVDAGEARLLAEAAMRHLARRFVVGRGVARTVPGLRVGASVKLSGLGALFDGPYTLTKVHHRFDAHRGLRTEFCCDRPWIGRET